MKKRLTNEQYSELMKNAEDTITTVGPGNGTGYTIWTEENGFQLVEFEHNETPYVTDLTEEQHEKIRIEEGKRYGY